MKIAKTKKLPKGSLFYTYFLFCCWRFCSSAFSIISFNRTSQSTCSTRFLKIRGGGLEVVVAEEEGASSLSSSKAPETSTELEFRFGEADARGSKGATKKGIFLAKHIDKANHPI